MIVNTSSYNNPNLIRITCEGTPVVLCDRYIGNYHFPFAGSIAAKMLLTLPENPDAETRDILLPSEIVVQESTQLRLYRMKQRFGG